MSALWISRIRLDRRRGDLAEFWSQGQRLRDPHRLVWSFFQAPEGTTRDFLFRQENDGEETVLYTLSRRRPEESPSWKIKSQAFDPRLSVGQRLQFSLRANAVQRVHDVRRHFPEMDTREATRLQGKIAGRIERRERPGEGKLAHPRSTDQKHDVVMLRKLAQRHLPESEREPEPELVQRAGLDWLRRQAEGDGGQNKGAGFRLVDGRVRADGYRQHRIGRRVDGKGKPDMAFSTIDFEGLLEVTDPTRMVERLWAGSSPGLGSARGFGCGLMLVRRPAPSWVVDDDDEGEDDA